MPDVNNSIYPINASTGDGTWFMGNSSVMGFTYDSGKSFKMGPNIRPNNQLVTTALMPVRGAHWVSNRRKLGVGHEHRAGDARSGYVVVSYSS